MAEAGDMSIETLEANEEMLMEHLQELANLLRAEPCPDVNVPDGDDDLPGAIGRIRHFELTLTGGKARTAKPPPMNLQELEAILAALTSEYSQLLEIGYRAFIASADFKTFLDHIGAYMEKVTAPLLTHSLMH